MFLELELHYQFYWYADPAQTLAKTSEALLIYDITTRGAERRYPCPSTPLLIMALGSFDNTVTKASTSNTKTDKPICDDSTWHV